MMYPVLLFDPYKAEVFVFSESGITCDVSRFLPNRRDCYDFAGNVWEVVIAADAEADRTTTISGRSSK